MATEQQAKFTLETIVKGRETGQEQMLEIARQLHANAARITEAVATRLEAIEERLLAIEAHYRSVKAKFGEVRSEIAALRLENAQAKAAVAELRAQVGELSFVSERLKVENKGPVGPRGMMGRDGRDGPRGEPGIRGERGETGSAAPMIVGWRIDSDRYLVTPQYSDGSSGPPLNLSAFVSDDDDEEG